jgi:acyl-coenzyme A synthetase/AMP-(fatty) acid ligase
MSDWLIQRLQDYSERPFLIAESKTISYSELVNKVDTFHAFLCKKGLKRGDVVTLEADYTLCGIAALFALFKIKAVVAPIATASSEEIKSRRTEANAKWNLNVRTNPDMPLLEPLDPIQPNHKIVNQLIELDHPGLVLFSSGSTGQPKAMIHDVDRLLEQFSKKRPRNHRILIFLLFDHIGGLNTLFNGLASGALIVVPESREPIVVAEAIEKQKVTLLPASPTFLNLLLMSDAVKKHDFSSLRFITYGTEPMPESLLIRLKKALPNVALIQTFGTSETGISQTVSRSSESTLIKIDDTNTEFKIVNGELWLRTKMQILGYLNHDMSRFTEDGWFKSGDLIEEADEGYFRIVGRLEELINVGGEKVSP